MERNHIQRPTKLVALRNGKTTAFCKNNTYNVADICEKLGCLNSFDNAVQACQKYPLTLKPYILNRIRKEGTKKWN